MDWYHRVDPVWLAARKDHLCASDITKLLPTTATGRKRKDMTGEYFAVWANKQCAIRDEDIVSRGVMARGHILERYAVDEINRQNILTRFAERLYHWDDMLVHRGIVSCSPDALDVPQDMEGVIAQGGDIEARTVVEIKAYNAETHYRAGTLIDADKLPERWQLATALYSMPSIEHGVLVFYNPSAQHPIFIRPYHRSDLTEELETIERISREYLEVIDDFKRMADSTCATGTCMSESEIVTELEALQDRCLDPWEKVRHEQEKHSRTRSFGS